RRIDLAIAAARTCLRVDRHAGIPDARDLRDHVVLDHDVHRAARRRARAVDQGRAANDEAAEWALALTTRRRDARVAAARLDRLGREWLLRRRLAGPLLRLQGRSANEEEDRRDAEEQG